MSGIGGGSWRGDAFTQSAMHDLVPQQQVEESGFPASGTLADLTTGSDVASAMGCASPDAFWKGDEAGSSCTDLVGSNDLSDVGTPTRSTADSNFSVNGIAFTANSTDACEASGTSILDSSTGSVAVCICATLTTKNDEVMSKWLSTGSDGWAFHLDSNGYITFYAAGTAATKVCTVAQDHTAGTGTAVILGAVDATADTTDCWTNLGSAAQATAPTGGVSSAAKVTVGNSTTWTGWESCEMTWCASMMWIDSNAEGITNTHRQSLEDWLGV